MVYIDHVARWSGGEIALARLLDALGQRVEAHVILGEEGELQDRLTALEGVTVEVLPMRATVRDARRDEAVARVLRVTTMVQLLAYIWRLRGRLRRLRPDIVHTNSLKAALYGGLAARLAGIPVVWHIRDRIAPDYLPKGGVWLVRTLARLIPRVVVTNSMETSRTLPVASQVVYDPLPADFAAPDGDRPDDVPRPFRVAMVGRLSPWKGQDLFLRAFADAFPDGSEEAWIIGSAMFGESEYEQQLHKLASDRGIAHRVRWLGFRDDVSTCLRDVDVLVHCSLIPEPFGQVVVEGMAAGLAVVAAAAGGPLEIIDDGVDGLLVEPGDREALSGALRRLANSPSLRAGLGRAGRESSVRYDSAAAARSLELLYSDAVGHLLRP